MKHYQLIIRTESCEIDYYFEYKSIEELLKTIPKKVDNLKKKYNYKIRGIGIAELEVFHNCQRTKFNSKGFYRFVNRNLIKPILELIL